MQVHILEAIYFHVDPSISTAILNDKYTVSGLVFINKTLNVVINTEGMMCIIWYNHSCTIDRYNNYQTCLHNITEIPKILIIKYGST